MSTALQQVKAGYEQWHALHTGSAEVSDMESPWYRWVREHFPPVEGKRVLEIACGRGAMVDWAAHRGALVTGCDISHVAVSEGRTRFGRDYLVGDIHQTCFPSGHFDVVICCETLEHTLDPDGALRELWRITAPGGRLFLTTPSYLNTYGLYRIYLKMRGRPFGTHGIQPIDRAFLAPALPARFRKAGWNVVKTDGLIHYFRPARDRMRWIEETPLIRKMLKHFALHFAVEAQRAAR